MYCTTEGTSILVCAWGNCNIEWTAHAETTPVVQEPSQRDMTGEAHTHTSV